MAEITICTDSIKNEINITMSEGDDSWSERMQNAIKIQMEAFL